MKMERISEEEWLETKEYAVHKKFRWNGIDGKFELERIKITKGLRSTYEEIYETDIEMSKDEIFQKIHEHKSGKQNEYYKVTEIDEIGIKVEEVGSGSMHFVKSKDKGDK